MTRTSSGRAVSILRSIVVRHQAAKIHSRTVDAWTAQALLVVYDNLNERNQAKFRRMLDAGPNSVGRLIEFAWAHTKLAGS